MEVSQTAFSFMLLIGLLCGGALGALYDGFRLIRRAIPGAESGPFRTAWFREKRFPLFPDPGERTAAPRRAGRIAARVLTWVTDVLFGFLYWMTVLLLLYDRNDGVFRWSVPVSVFAGLLLYRFTVGRLTERLTDVILDAVTWLFRYLLRILCLPFLLLRRWIRTRILDPLRMAKKRRAEAKAEAERAEAERARMEALRIEAEERKRTWKTGKKQMSQKKETE